MHFGLAVKTNSLSRPLVPDMVLLVKIRCRVVSEVWVSLIAVSV